MARDLTERGNVQASQPGSNLSNTRFAERLRNAITGEVMFDLYARGRYATDASIYQMMPAAVVIPRSTDEMASALAIAREEGVAVTPRGGAARRRTGRRSMPPWSWIRRDTSIA